ncbi:hypothetical protein NLJ89_g1015 [Agrocybe chaxingu]|uniref:SAM domain-containing protein n=1 Tax=Agrocybe chaxingu TaxID=84603 RepID=A0A9W8N0Y3_9AGAR|nr:hypothetical protein NLJ89_g1015 [Agrocybe chaxingu]
MSAIIVNSPLYALDNSPPNPTSPTTQFMSQSSAQPRSFMTLAHGDQRPPLQPVKYQQYTPMDPPQGMSYAAFLRTWNDDTVARWLNEIKCGCHDETFRANDIRGDVLLELDQVTLKEMGISSIGDRLRILNAVKEKQQRRR